MKVKTLMTTNLIQPNYRPMTLLFSLMLMLIVLSACIGPAEPLVLQGDEDLDLVEGGTTASDTDGEIDLADVDVSRVSDDAAEVSNGEVAFDELALDQILVRATYLLGLDVANQNGEALGNVEDLIMDMETGEVLYAILDRSELLGLLEDERPVPLAALEWNPELSLTLTMAQDALDVVPDIDDDWPDKAGIGWDSEIASVWREQGLPIPLEREATPVRIRDLIGMHSGGMGDDLAIAEDFLIDMNTAQSEYVALFNPNGFHAPDRIVLIPLSSASLEVETVDNSPTYSLVLLAVDSQTLEDAPSIDRNVFQTVDLLDAALVDALNTYWNKLSEVR